MTGVPGDTGAAWGTETCPSCGDEFRNLGAHLNHPFVSCEPEGDADVEDPDTYHTRHGSDFETARDVALERAGYRCERCGITDDEHRERDDLFPPNGGLHVHHKTPTTEFDDMAKAHDPSNLEVLCADCHGV